MRKNQGETFTIDHRRIQHEVETYRSTKDKNVYPSEALSSKDENDCAVPKQKNRDVN